MIPLLICRSRSAPRAGHLARARAAFTLIEVLMVVVAMAIIAGVVVPQVTSAIDDAKNSAMLKDLREITMAIERYRMDHAGSPPDLIQNDTLVQLVQKTDADGNVGAGAQHIYGPYLPEIGRNPLNGVARVFRVNSAPPSSLSSRVGWVYHPTSGQIWAGLYAQFVDLAAIPAEGEVPAQAH
jgi:prepilin-type N-terminal cleavage/methylation domain-containing protein